jgi:hypothetical protein
MAFYRVGGVAGSSHAWFCQIYASVSSILHMENRSNKTAAYAYRDTLKTMRYTE